MRVERKVIKENLIQITFEDERWYLVDDVYIPSVTWILSAGLPKGIGFYKWLADKGWDEAEAIKQAAGDKGSKVHHAIEDIIDGKTVKYDSKYVNNTTGQAEELNADEYACVMSFVEWANENKVKFLKQDFIVCNKEVGYCGTVDFLCQIGDVKYLVDIKTSQSVYLSHEVQVSAYIHADEELKDAKGAILQVGYKKNKKSYKFTPLEDKFDLFLAARQIWANECAEMQPSQKDYPLELKLNAR